MSAERHAAGAVLMIRPRAFGANAETLATNAFQTPGGGATVAAAALREFDALAAALADAGVRVHAFAGQPAGDLPDEVFPNNWLSLHADGTAVLYPMQAPNRRRERRADVLDGLASAGYRLERVVDLSALERNGKYLEGTGSLVLARDARVAFACRSARTHAEALGVFAERLGYDVVAFRAADRNGRAIYHTNVLMSVGPAFAALCTAAIADTDERKRVIERLEAAGRELVDLTFDELHAFAGNMLALAGTREPIVALSATAWDALGAANKRALERHGRPVAVTIGTIERHGGGSVRCMLAEVHLPAR